MTEKTDAISNYRLICILQNIASNDADLSETFTAYTRLKDAGMTDEEITLIGLDWILPEKET